MALKCKDGVHEGIRTHDRTLRRRVLYPAELRRRMKETKASLFFRMASTRGFEPMTARLEGVCSIQLSYVDISQTAHL